MISVALTRCTSVLSVLQLQPLDQTSIARFPGKGAGEGARVGNVTGVFCRLALCVLVGKG